MFLLLNDKKYLKNVQMNYLIFKDRDSLQYFVLKD